MGLFTQGEMSKINKAAKKSNSNFTAMQKPKHVKKNAKADIDEMSNKVQEYFGDSEAVLITTVNDLHDYVTRCIEAGYCGIDTETTGLDRINDHVVGFSLYYPGGHECYVPNNHLVYIFDERCKDQLTYEQCAPELQRLVDGKCKMIFANADFDIAMIWHDFKVDFCDVCYYDVILAWRVLKEDEPRNGLKELYSKYVLKGEGDPKKFSDFFTPQLFPYCKPQVAKLYAANDAKITYELFRWQLPYTIKTNPKCQKNHLERLSDIIWNIEFPMIKVCAKMHRNGIYFDRYVAEKVQIRYHNDYNNQLNELRQIVDDLVHDLDTPNNRKRPFKTGYDFVPTSPKHVQYLCYDLLKLPDVGGKRSTDKNILRDFGLPQTDTILTVRSLSTLINSFVDKLIRISGQSEGRIHGQFRSIGADTGRMSCIEGNQLVLTSTGYVPIKDIKVGDVVACFDDDLSMQWSPVTYHQKTGNRCCIKVVYEDVDTGKIGHLVCTPEHAIRITDGTWQAAVMLNVGDKLVSSTGNIVFKSHVALDGTYDVYDITVEGYHNFVVNGIDVHNSSEPNMQNIPSHATDIRHMFRATIQKDEDMEIKDDCFTLKYFDRVQTDNGFVPCGNLNIGDSLILQDGKDCIVKQIMDIRVQKDNVTVRIC